MFLTNDVKKALNEGHKVYHFEPHAPGLQLKKIGDIIFYSEITNAETSPRYEYNFEPRGYKCD